MAETYFVPVAFRRNPGLYPVCGDAAFRQPSGAKMAVLYLAACGVTDGTSCCGPD